MLDEKLWVFERLGSMLEPLDIDGCIITTEGFGNNHIDFIQHIGQAGERGIPVVEFHSALTRSASSWK